LHRSPTWLQRRCSSQPDLAVHIDLVAETGSTNADLLVRLAAGEAIAEGYWLVADRQLAGRGRQGRQWLDASGNFMGSTVVELGPGDPPPPTLSFLAALAVYGVASGKIARPASLQLKWPNDILLSGAKFCGILLEREGRHAVIGIGVNLAEAPKLGDRETLALAEFGPAPDRDLFARDLAQSFATELERWRHYGIGPMLSRWQAAAHRPGTRLSVHAGSAERIAGTYTGLAADGALCLRLDDGSLRTIHAGDVMLEAS